MTAPSSTPPVVAGRGGAPAVWLHGPTLDLLLGAGVAYLLTLPLLIGLDFSGRLTQWPVIAAALFSMFIAGPHYGATILRVYDRREDRRQYALFAIWVSAALVGLFVVGLHFVVVGSILVTLYSTWSPWHYSGQNYGISMMFLRRRGIAVDAQVRRFLYASFVLSFALAILAMHSAAVAQQSYADAGTFSSQPVSDASVFRFLTLGIPREVARIGVAVTAIAYLIATVSAGVLLLRRARAIDLLPVGCLVLTQALWFALPAVMPIVAGIRLGGPAFVVVWLSAAHSAQYLWVTSYYAAQQAREQADPLSADPKRVLRIWWVRALLAGTAVSVLPALVFAPALLGTVAFDNGLAILVVAVANLHHFVLDGAVWKLRDGRVARLLLRDVSASAAVNASAPRGGWLRPILTAIGTASLAVALLDVWDREFVINRAGDDLEKIAGAARQLAWIGRDAAVIHTHLAEARVDQGRLDDAIGEYRRSLAIHESPDAWLGLGAVQARRGAWQEASDAYGAAFALAPEDPRIERAVRQLRMRRSEWRSASEPARTAVE